MIRVLIADDEAPAREKLARWLALEPDLQIVATCRDGIDAAHAIETHKPQLAFLDIQMPGLSGLELAAQLEALPEPKIVFVTAFDEHAIRAFDLNAIDYLLKPYDRERLQRTLLRVRQRMGHTTNDAVEVARTQFGALKRLLVPVQGRIELLEVEQIMWLESCDNYVNVHTASRAFLLRRTLQDLVEQLGDRFVRVHRTSAVNVAHVKSLAPLMKGDYEIQLQDGRALRMSRRYKDELLGRLPR
ncbi:MAG TPA: response regulator [Steroidobacteraceae bacterium]|nr:response regulator [Steroidobacteraceae bacterium]